MSWIPSFIVRTTLVVFDMPPSGSTFCATARVPADSPFLMEGFQSSQNAKLEKRLSRQVVLCGGGQDNAMGAGRPRWRIWCLA